MSSQANEPTVAVCVPAYNEAASLAVMLECVNAALSGLKCSGLVVMAGGADGTAEVAAQALSCVDRAKVLKEPERRGKANAMNELVAATTADIIVFCDADVLVRPGAIAALVRHLCRTRDAGAASGRVEAMPGHSRFWSWLASENANALNAMRARGLCSWMICGHFFAIRRDIWEPLPVGVVTDDAYIGLLLKAGGITAAYCAEAGVRVRGPQSFIEYSRQKLRNRLGRLQLSEYGLRLGHAYTGSISIHAATSAGLAALRYLHVLIIDTAYTIAAHLLYKVGVRQTVLWDYIPSSKITGAHED